MGWGFRAWFIIIAAAVLLAWLGHLGYQIYNAGSNNAKLEQATGQLQQNQKAVIKHAKIAKSAPPASDRIARGMWVLQFARSGQ